METITHAHAVTPEDQARIGCCFCALPARVCFGLRAPNMPASRFVYVCLEHEARLAAAR